MRCKKSGNKYIQNGSRLMDMSTQVLRHLKYIQILIHTARIIIQKYGFQLSKQEHVNSLTLLKNRGHYMDLNKRLI
jgi:hypothetical protein